MFFSKIWIVYRESKYNKKSFLSCNIFSYLRTNSINIIYERFTLTVYINVSCFYLFSISCAGKNIIMEDHREGAYETFLCLWHGPYYSC